MLRRGIIYLILGLFFALFFNIKISFAYDSSVAHPNIASLAVRAYNFQNFPDITESQLNYILQGAQEEDTPIRWLNHFYDPVYDIGFSDFPLSDDVGPYQKAPSWLQSPYEQAKYADGDRSWQRALDDYARGDEENAFIELGHAIHLISDMAVPAHTRDSMHVGDSYESFVKNNWDLIKSKISYGFTEINSLEQAFYDLAIYSNNNFYNDRTIESKKYNIIDVEILKIFKNQDDPYGLYKSKNDGHLVYISKIQADWKKNSLIEENLLDPLNTGLILLDYSKNLIPKAISYSAGLIKLFLEQAEAKKAEMQYEEMSWWEKIKSIFTNPELPYYRQTVGGYASENLGVAIDLGGDVLNKVKETKETLDKIATENEEPKDPEKIIEEVQAEEITSDKEQVASTINEVASSKDQVASTEPIVPYYSSGGGGSSYTPPIVEPTTTPEIELDLEISAPELFLELLQTTTTNFITLNFSTTETTSLPVYFEGEVNTNTSWSALFPWTTSTSYIFETNKSGLYDFRVRAVDFAFNTSSWTQTATSVPIINYEYNYLSGDQVEDTVVLTKSGSPYIIDKRYYVPENKTLRIEAGTVVKSLYVDSDNHGILEIAGTLEVLGTEEEKIIFTSVYDHNFENQKIATLNYSGILADGNWGGIRSYEGANIKMDNFEIRYAGEPVDTGGDVYIAWLVIYFDKCLDLSLSNVEIKNGKLQNCGMYAAGFDRTVGYFKDSSINSSIYGVDVFGGNMLLENLKFSGFIFYPLATKGFGLTMNNLVFENNRLNGAIDRNLSGDIVLAEREIPYILDQEIFYTASSLTVNPGVKIYIDNNEYFSIPANFNGASDNHIKVYLNNVYRNGLRLEGSEANFSYVDFINNSPFLDDISAKSLGVNTVSDLMSIDYMRADFFGAGDQRAFGLAVRNGTANLQNVNFINGAVPWFDAILLINNSSSLNNVSFYNDKSEELFYLEETDSRGIEISGGSLSLDNVNFSDLVYGVYYSSGLGFSAPTIMMNNMSEDRFVNVLNKSYPSDLLVFPDPIIPTSSTSTPLEEIIPPEETTSSTTSTSE